MRFVQTLAMVGQDFDDPTGLNTTSGTLLDHALDLSTESDKASDFCVDLRDMVAGDYIDLSTGSLRLIRKFKKLPDRFNLKAKLPSMADEPEPPHRRFIIRATIPFRPVRRWKQPDALVVPDGRYLHAGLIGNSTYRE